MQTRDEVPGLSDMLCGLSRPVFFTGVATVVNRLLNLVQPDVAYFGRKDYQQLMIIRKMVEDLAIPVEIRGVDTVREADGLAMSSRNNYLGAEQRKTAAHLYQVLCEAVEAYSNHKGSRAEVEQAARAKLTGYGFDPDYVEIRRSLDLGAAGDHDRELIILAAAWLDGTRLIDNLSFTVPA
jgi:pantoate--beta-alanine ligase